jgi:ABC-2 type transport system ATP-binding protein
MVFLIEVRNLTKAYGHLVAVDNLNFTIEPGKIYGFLGPNGAGKSTTMNIITGCLAATEGQVLVNGHDIFEEPLEAKKCIGYLPEQPPLYLDMTVIDYLRFVAQAKDVNRKEREQKIQEAMEKTGILEVKNRLIKNLSKGFKQRVGLAQAILGDPQIIILDEPTVGLDPKQIIEIRDLIKLLSKSHTVMLSSHIMQEISAVCDHLLIISGGKLVASGTPETLSSEAMQSHTLALTVKGGEDQIKAAFAKMPQLSIKEMAPAKEADAMQLQVAYSADLDPREELFYLMAKERCPILSMTRKTVSLEDVFLELTGAKEPEPAEPKKGRNGAAKAKPKQESEEGKNDGRDL